MKKCCEYIESAIKNMEDSVKRNEELVANHKFCIDHGLQVNSYQEDIDWLNDRKEKLKTLKRIQQAIYYCHDEMSFCEICGELKPNSELVQDGICDECWEDQPDDDDFGGAPSKSAQQGLDGSLI